MSIENSSEEHKDKALSQVAVSSFLSIKEVASKYGETISCMFHDYDNKWKRKTMIVNYHLLRDMEQGSVKDCY